MPTRYRRRDRGVYYADQLTRRLGDELRTAWPSAGVSQRAVADAAGISASQVRRIELGKVRSVPLRTLAVLFGVLGMRLSARPYPEGPPLRDAAHARLLARFRAQLSPDIRLHTEVPLSMDGDLRAWDGELEAPDGETCKLEAETAIHDLQATHRRIALKMADDGVGVLILLVAATHQNRRVLRESHELVQTRYPAGTREMMGALREGHLPLRSGIVVP